MKLWRSALGMLLVAGVTGSLSAQPEKALREAVDQLLGAGNYSWGLGREGSIDGRKIGRAGLRLTHTGETVIGGFTAMKMQRLRVVFDESEIAYALKGGWRHADDLTESDRKELREFWNSVVPPSRGRGARQPRPALPHELLPLLLREVHDVRQEHAAIVGDLSGVFGNLFELEQYLRTGILPAAGRGRSRDSGSSGSGAKIVVYLDRGAITEFSVEFSATRTVANGPDQGSQQTMVNTLVVKLTKIGETQVEIDPEALALFRSGAEKPPP